MTLVVLLITRVNRFVGAQRGATVPTRCYYVLLVVQYRYYGTRTTTAVVLKVFTVLYSSSGNCRTVPVLYYVCIVQLYI